MCSVRQESSFVFSLCQYLVSHHFFLTFTDMWFVCLSTLDCFDTFVKTQLTMGLYVTQEQLWVYFWALYPVPLIYFFILIAIVHFLDYDSFLIRLKISRTPPTLFFFFIIVLAFGILCKYFRISLFSSRKIPAGILVGFTLTL